MADAVLGGVCPVLAVPFREDGEIDVEGFDRIVDHLLKVGVNGLMLFGLASEFHKLSDRERVTLRRRFLQVTRAIPDVAGIVSVTDHATELAIRSACAAQAEGADALNLLPPHFLRPSSEAVTAHIEAVVDAVELPVIVQYAPGEAATAVTPETLAVIAGRHPNLRHVKVESQPPGRLVTHLDTLDPPLRSFVGYAGVQLPDALRRGAVGVQPGCSFAELYVDLWSRWHSGEVDRFLIAHTRLLPYLAYWMQSVELVVRAEKRILQRRGLIGDDRCREPSWNLDDEEEQMIERFLTEYTAELSR